VLEVVADVFTNELQRSGVIHIGGCAQARPLFTRVLHLVKAPRALKSGAPAQAPGRQE
jgi:hypothetical protein